MKALLKRTLVFMALFLAIQVTTPVSTYAQCPMCKMSAEQNLKDGGTAGKGLNKGILYMLLTPYVVIGSIGFFWYRNRNKEVDQA